MYAHCVLYLGIPPDYFLDKMEWYEIGAIMKYGYKKHMTEYECARMGAYVTAQVNSKKHLTPQHIAKFEWENKDKKVKGKKKRDTTEVTKEDVERLNEKRKAFQMQFKTLPPMN